MQSSILGSAVINFLTTTTLLFTILSALLLGVYTGYWSIRGILSAFGRRSTKIPVKGSAKVVPFPASISARS